jgi:hypothetical protein
VTLAVRAGGFSPGAGRVGGAVGCDPLDDARALLALTRLLYRARVAAARHGVLPARSRARALVPLGRRLAEAMGAAEAAGEGSAARAAALERVAALGVEVWASVDPQSEGLRGLLTEALRGVRGEAPSKVPQAAEGFGQRW